jgi:hypothetical protein
VRGRIKNLNFLDAYRYNGALRTEEDLVAARVGYVLRTAEKVARIRHRKHVKEKSC